MQRILHDDSGPSEIALAVAAVIFDQYRHGFAVADQAESLGDIPADVHDEIGYHDRWSWDQPFVEFARLEKRGGPTARMGRQQVQLWTEALESVSDAGRVLIISHGRVIEAGLVSAVLEGDFVTWGAPFQHCEGVRLAYEGESFSVVQFLRIEVPRDKTQLVARSDGTCRMSSGHGSP